MTTKASTLVLVSGGSGYLGLHCVNELLKAGYLVRATVRDPANAAKCQPLRDLAKSDPSRLELVKADLLDEACWPAAVKDVDFVLHTASPFPVKGVADEQLLIRPAREGTLNVLKAVAATNGHVKRVVLTSSIAAIAYGQMDKANYTFTEADWTNVDGGADVTAYEKSKTLAERAAWDFVKELPSGQKFELATINPGFIMGPLLGGSDCSSADVIRDFMMRKMPALPRFKIGYVDVRDVAQAHVRAMEKPEAAGERFLLSSSVGWFKDVCVILKAEFGKYGYNPPTCEAPSFLLRLLSYVSPELKGLVPRLNYDFNVDSSKMRRVLGMEPIALEKTMRDMGHSLIQRGFVARKPAYVEPPNHLSA